MLQPATKALAQMLAGRTGVSGQLGHARTMLAQAERMIAERAHNRLTPAEREEFFEQLARLKLTLADADAEAEVQAVEEQVPRPQAPPVAQERLKEMALALSVRERPSQAETAAPPAPPADEIAAEPTADAPAESSAPQAQASDEEVPEQPVSPSSNGRGRLVLPKASADQAAQAVAVGAFARRRSRAAAAARAATAEEAARNTETEAETSAAETPPAETPGVESQAVEHPGPDPRDRAAGPREGNGAALGTETTAPAKPRRGRKPKHQGLPEGWVIDEEGFVVPGVD